MSAPFTAEEIRTILANPIYAGMGSFPALVGEETWLDANVRFIEEESAPDAIRCVLAQFEGTFPGAPTPDAGSYVRQAVDAPRDALRRLLRDLRRAAEAFRNREAADIFLQTITQSIPVRHETNGDPSNGSN